MFCISCLLDSIYRLFNTLHCSVNSNLFMIKNSKLLFCLLVPQLQTCTVLHKQVFQRVHILLHQIVCVFRQFIVQNAILVGSHVNFDLCSNRKCLATEVYFLVFVSVSPQSFREKVPWFFFAKDCHVQHFACVLIWNQHVVASVQVVKIQPA